MLDLRPVRPKLDLKPVIPEPPKAPLRGAANGYITQEPQLNLEPLAVQNRAQEQISPRSAIMRSKPMSILYKNIIGARTVEPDYKPLDISPVTQRRSIRDIGTAVRDTGIDLTKQLGGELTKLGKIGGKFGLAAATTLSPTSLITDPTGEHRLQAWEEVRKEGEGFQKPVLDTMITAGLLGYGLKSAIGALRASHYWRNLPEIKQANLEAKLKKDYISRLKTDKKFYESELLKSRTLPTGDVEGIAPPSQFKPSEMPLSAVTQGVPKGAPIVAPPSVPLTPVKLDLKPVIPAPAAVPPTRLGAGLIKPETPVMPQISPIIPEQVKVPEIQKTPLESKARGIESDLTEEAKMSAPLKVLHEHKARMVGLVASGDSLASNYLKNLIDLMESRKSGRLEYAYKAMQAYENGNTKLATELSEQALGYLHQDEQGIAEIEWEMREKGEDPDIPIGKAQEAQPAVEGKVSPAEIAAEAPMKIDKRFDKWVSFAKDKGFSESEAMKFAKGKLAAESKAVKPVAEQPKQMEIGDESGVKGFGKGAKGEQELDFDKPDKRLTKQIYERAKALRDDSTEKWDLQKENSILKHLSGRISIPWFKNNGLSEELESIKKSLPKHLYIKHFGSDAKSGLDEVWQETQGLYPQYQDMDMNSAMEAIKEEGRRWQNKPSSTIKDYLVDAEHSLELESRGLPQDFEKQQMPLSKEEIIKSRISKQEVKRLVERHYNALKDVYRDNEIMSADDYLNNRDLDIVNIEMGSDGDVMNRFQKIFNDVENVDIDDVVKLYREGKLEDRPITTTFKLQDKSISNIPRKEFAGFWAGNKKWSGDIGKLYEKAKERLTNTNRSDVNEARKNLFILANTNPNLHNELKISKPELNKLLKTYTGINAEGIETQRLLNEGVPEQFQWVGIQNLNYINRTSINPYSINEFVKKIEIINKAYGFFGDAGKHIREMITHTILGINTPLTYEDLSIFIKSLEKAKGLYENANTSITISSGGQHTVSHEIGHYLDYKFARELGIDNTSLSLFGDSANWSYVKEHHNLSDEHIQWAKEFYEFVNNLSEKSDISSEYLQRKSEVFARFVDKFVRWVNKKAGGYELSEPEYYRDMFTENNFKDFVKILQRKAYIDSKYNIKSLVSKGTGSIEADLPKDIKAVGGFEQHTGEKLTPEQATEKGIANRKRTDGKKKWEVPAVRDKSGIFAEKEFQDYPFRDIGGKTDNMTSFAAAMDNIQEGKGFGPMYNLASRAYAQIADRNDFITESVNKVSKLAHENGFMKGVWGVLDKKDGEIIFNLLEGGKPAGATDKHRAFVKGMRPIYDELREMANKVRKPMGKPEIGYIENYASHMRKVSLYADLIKHFRTSMSENFDFVIPNEKKNPFAMKRIGEMENKETNFWKIIDRYIQAVSNDVYLSPLVEKLKIVNSVLEGREMFKAKKFIDNYIRSNLFKKPDVIDNFIGMREGTMLRRISSKVINARQLGALAGNIEWILFTQPMSLGLTFMKTNPVNFVIGGLKWLSPSVRREIHKMAVMRLKGKAGVVTSAMGDVDTMAAKVYTSRINKFNSLLGWLGDTMEYHLTGISAAAGLEKGKSYGLSGKELELYGDYVAQVTQSMYNPEARMQILNSMSMRLGFPFQTFAGEMFRHLRTFVGSGGGLPLNMRQRAGHIISLIVATIVTNYITQKARGRKLTTVGSFVPFVGKYIDEGIGKVKDVVAEKIGKPPVRKWHGTGMAPMAVMEDVNKLVDASVEAIKYGKFDKFRKELIFWGMGLAGVGGAGQVTKVIDGIIAAEKGYTESASGRVRYPIQCWDKVWSVLRGPYQTTEAREYRKLDLRPLGAKQSEKFKGLTPEERKDNYKRIQEKRLREREKTKRRADLRRQ